MDAGCRKSRVTAGASVPEVLVEEVIAWLKNYHVTDIHEVVGTAEFTKFNLPDLPDF